jgi:hypothetical protein|tara:strand:- start:336 stop:554 length:219 start_codon:yes stop_codon:yes gene_type:complete
MKKSKLINNLDKSIDSLYDSLYAVRDALEKVEDEELDFLANSFVDQLELSVVEGEYNYERIREYIEKLYEEE